MKNRKFLVIAGVVVLTLSGVASTMKFLPASALEEESPTTIGNTSINNGVTQLDDLQDWINYYPETEEETVIEEEVSVEHSKNSVKKIAKVIDATAPVASTNEVATVTAPIETPITETPVTETPVDEVQDEEPQITEEPEVSEPIPAPGSEWTDKDGNVHYANGDILFTDGTFEYTESDGVRTRRNDFGLFRFNEEAGRWVGVNSDMSWKTFYCCGLACWETSSGLYQNAIQAQDTVLEDGTIIDVWGTIIYTDGTREVNGVKYRQLEGRLYSAIDENGDFIYAMENEDGVAISCCFQGMDGYTYQDAILCSIGTPVSVEIIDGYEILDFGDGFRQVNGTLYKWCDYTSTYVMCNTNGEYYRYHVPTEDDEDQYCIGSAIIQLGDYAYETAIPDNIVVD